MYLCASRVTVEFFHQVHTPFGVYCPVDDAILQTHQSQVNCNYLQHAGPLGHDHTALAHSNKYTGVLATFSSR